MGTVALVITPEGFVASETLAAAAAEAGGVVLKYDEVLAVDDVVLVAVDVVVLVADTEVLVVDVEVLAVEVLDAASVVLAADVLEDIFKFSEELLKTALSFGAADDFAADSAALFVVLALLVEVTDGGSRTLNSSADFTELVTTLLLTGDFAVGFVVAAACFVTVPVGLMRSTAIFFTVAVAAGFPVGPLACALAPCFVGIDLT